MDQQIEHLIKLLEQIEFLYRSLLPIIEEEKESAIHSDIDRLTAANFEKHSIIDQIKFLDEQLKVTAHLLAVRYQVTKKDLRISVLAEKMPPKYADRLKQLNRSLNGVVKKVQTSNAQCKSLVQHCIRLVQNTLIFFQHWAGMGDVYSRTGNIRTDGKVSRHILSGMV